MVPFYLFKTRENPSAMPFLPNDFVESRGNHDGNWEKKASVAGFSRFVRELCDDGQRVSRILGLLIVSGLRTDTGENTGSEEKRSRKGICGGVERFFFHPAITTRDISRSFDSFHQ